MSGYPWDSYQFKNVTFHNVMKYIEEPKLRKETVAKLVKAINDKGLRFDAVAGIDSRGYPLAVLLAHYFECKLILIRKAGKLPENILETVEYKTEYSTEKLTVEKSTCQAGMRVLIADDILATGGSINAVVELMKRCGVETVGAVVLLDIKIATLKVPTISLLSLRQDLVEYQVAANELPCPNKCNIVAFSGPTMEYFVQGLIMHNPAIRRGLVDWNAFPDNWPNICFDANIKDCQVIFVVSSNVSEMFKELHLLKVLPRQGIKSLDIIVPYFAPGTMERVDKEGTLATAETFAKMLSEIEMTSTGPATVHLYDVHALPERFYFGQGVKIKMHSMVDLFIDKIKSENVTICFPDEGSYKRFSGKFKEGGFPTVTCSKIRVGNDRVITCEGFDPTKPFAKRIIIIDDICHSGGTLFETCRALKKLGAEQIDAFIVHGVFENVGYLDFIHSGKKAGFTNFYVTDSTPASCNLHNRTPFSILSMAQYVAGNFHGPCASPTQVTRPITVAVATTSEVKLRGVYTGFGKQFTNIKLFGVKNIKSGVPEQPRNENIAIGMNNRMDQLLAKNLDMDYYVSIESGIENNQEITFVKIVKRDGTTHSLPITVYDIPQKFNPNNTLDPNLTAGTLISNYYGCASDDWYQRFTGNPRYKYIATAIETLLDK